MSCDEFDPKITSERKGIFISFSQKFPSLLFDYVDENVRFFTISVLTYLVNLKVKRIFWIFIFCTAVKNSSP